MTTNNNQNPNNSLKEALLECIVEEIEILLMNPYDAKVIRELEKIQDRIGIYLFKELEKKAKEKIEDKKIGIELQSQVKYLEKLEREVQQKQPPLEPVSLELLFAAPAEIPEKITQMLVSNSSLNTKHLPDPLHLSNELDWLENKSGINLQNIKDKKSFVEMLKEQESQKSSISHYYPPRWHKS